MKLDHKSFALSSHRREERGGGGASSPSPAVSQPHATTTAAASFFPRLLDGLGGLGECVNRAIEIAENVGLSVGARGGSLFMSRVGTKGRKGADHFPLFCQAGLAVRVFVQNEEAPGK